MGGKCRKMNQLMIRFLASNLFLKIPNWEVGIFPREQISWNITTLVYNINKLDSKHNFVPFSGKSD